MKEEQMTEEVIIKMAEEKERKEKRMSPALIFLFVISALIILGLIIALAIEL